MCVYAKLNSSCGTEILYSAQAKPFFFYLLYILKICQRKPEPDRHSFSFSFFLNLSAILGILRTAGGILFIQDL